MADGNGSGNGNGDESGRDRSASEKNLRVMFHRAVDNVRATNRRASNAAKEAAKAPLKSLADVAEAVAMYDVKGRIRLKFSSSEDMYDIAALQDHALQVQHEVESQQGEVGERPPRMNICIMITGTRGDVQPFIGIAKRLQEDGHRVRLATHAVYRDFVMGYGVEFYPLGGDPKELAAYMVKTGGHMIPLKYENLRDDVPKNIRMLEEILNSTWPAVSAADPDGKGKGIPGDPFVAQAIISNPVTYGHIHVAERLGVPLHIMFPQPWVPTVAYPHPMSNMPYDNTPSNINYMSYKLVDFLMWQGTESMVNRFRSHVLNLRKIRKGDGGRDILLDLGIPHAFMWSPLLSPKPADWGDIYDVVGTVTLKQAGSNYKPSPELEAFLNKGDPPIFVGFGSMVIADPPATTKMIIEAAEQANVRVLIQSSWSDMSGGIEVPDNIFFLGECPHDWLMPRVGAVVHHGGAGTTAAGLMAGKPTFIVPFFGDQPFWGRAVVNAGVGVEPCPIAELNVKRLRAAFEELQTPSMRLHAKELGKAMLQEDGVENAVQAFYRHMPLKKMLCDLDKSNLATKWSNTAQLKLCDECVQILSQRPDTSDDDFVDYHCIDYSSRGPDSALEGASSGAGVFLDELGNGVKDIFMKPANGYRDEGVKGAMVGFAKGVGGLIICPIKGAALFADHVATGVYNEYRADDERKKGNVLIDNRVLASLGYSVAPDIHTGNMRPDERSDSTSEKVLVEKDQVIVHLSHDQEKAMVSKFQEVITARQKNKDDAFRIAQAIPESVEEEEEKQESTATSSKNSFFSGFKKSKAEKSVLSEAVLTQLEEAAKVSVQRQTSMLEKVKDKNVPKLNVCLLATGSWDDGVQQFAAIGLRLKKDGHRVRVATHEQYRHKIMDLGLEFFPLGGDPTLVRRYLLHQYQQVKENKKGLFSFKSLGFMREEFPELEDLRTLVFSLWPACTVADPHSPGIRFRADAVIANPLLLGIDTVAERLGVPVQCVSTIPSSRTHAFPHVLSPSFELSQPYQYTVPNATSYDDVYALMRNGMDDILDTFRSSIGLSGKASSHNLVQAWEIPHSYLWEPSLLQRPFDWGAGISISGFVDLETKDCASSTSTEAVESFAKTGDGRPVIFCGITQQEDPHSIIHELELAAEQTKMRVILQFQEQDGARVDLHKSDTVMELGPTFPIKLILPLCNAAIHSGSYHVMSACLQAGLASCVIVGDPMQRFWGKVLALAGAGVEPLDAHLTAAALVPKLVQITAEPLISSVKRFGSWSSDQSLDRIVQFFYANLPLEAMTCDLDPTLVARIYDPISCLKLSYEAHLAIRSVVGHDVKTDIKYKPLKYSGLRAPHFNLRELEPTATRDSLTSTSKTIVKSLRGKMSLERGVSSAAIVLGKMDAMQEARAIEINAAYDRALTLKNVV